MKMTISIFLIKQVAYFSFLVFLLSNTAFSKQIPQTASRVPADSFFVLSLNVNALFNKSKIKESRVWEPIIKSWNLINPDFHSLISDFNNKGFNTSVPAQIFVRTSNTEKNSLSIGMLAQIKDVSKADLSINNLAESLGFNQISDNRSRFQKNGTPIEFGRKGKLFYIIGLGPVAMGNQDVSLSLEKLFQGIPNRALDQRFPASLKTFFSTKSDIGFYIDGSGFANLLENNWPDDRWRNFLPLMDPLFSRQFGVHITSYQGSIKLSAEEYITGKREPTEPPEKLSLINSIPGDSPLVARLSLPTEELSNTLNTAIDKFLRALSNNQITKDSKLPGFESSASELLSSVKGDFVVAGGNLSEKSFVKENGQVGASLRPVFLMGAEIKNQFALKQLLAGLKAANTLGSITNNHDIHITHKQNHFWLSSIEYLREIRAGKPLKRLPKQRIDFLNQNAFAIDIDINRANKNIRENSFLTFPQLKSLNIADDFNKISIYEKDGILFSDIKLNDENKFGWEVIFKHIGQSIIDKINFNIYQAISQNNLNSVIQSVQAGALINATDRFGHSPMHYAAYKGNPRIVDYLLNNGGNPNIRGRHDSTPLHSAAWGRNKQVLELLLEDGADVDARTDEGETPGMTAALRGEKDMLEILFSLSADPHATDIHGTNLVDLAAAGGHKAIVDLLQEIGVSNKNPLHVAAGLGDLNKIKRLLENGHSINKRDAFGATPLLVAMVSGKEDVVDFLLSKNANPLLSAKDGYTIMHGAAFSGKKSLVRKALSFDLDVNSRYGPDGITPVDVAEESGDALPLLRALGGKTAWELGRVSK